MAAALLMAAGCGGRIVGEDATPTPDPWCVMPDLGGPYCHPARATVGYGECEMPDGTVWDIISRDAVHLRRAANGLDWEKLCDVSLETGEVLWRKEN